MIQGRRWGLWLVAPAGLMVLLFLVAPLAVSLGLSLSNFSLLGSSTRFEGLANYWALLAHSDAPGGFVSDFLITLRFTVVSVALETALGLLLAMFLSQKFALTGWLRTLMTVPLMIAPVVSGLQWKYLFDPQVGLVNYLFQTLHLISGPQNWLSQPGAAWWLIVVADVWQTTGFMTLFLLAGLQSVPADVMEAARIDGAGAFGRFVRVLLPLIWPVLASAVVLRAMDAFRIFDLAYVLTGGGPLYASETVSIFTYRVGLAQFNMGLASASSILVLVAVVLLSLPLMRTLLRESY